MDFFVKNGYLPSALFFIFYTATIKSIDNWHYYRAPFWFDQTRFETPGYGTLELRIGGGGTSNSFSPLGEKSELFDRCGVFQLSQLGAGIENLDPLNPIDQLLLDLKSFPLYQNFGAVSYKGHFGIAEFQIQWYQNFIGGFFARAHTPFRIVTLKKLSYIDLSPSQGTYSITNPTWQNFLSQLPQVYKRYGIADTLNKKAGLGDVSFLGGWSKSYTKTNYADFIDAGIQCGVMMPTSSKVSASHPFDVPLGYNGFWGAPLIFDTSIGFFEWLTVSAHIDGLFLFKKKTPFRIKTSAEQSGLIFLPVETVMFNPGTIWNLALDLLADHAIRGFSLRLGYVYSQADHDCVTPSQLSTVNPNFITTDDRLKGWRMHTFLMNFDYDCSHRINDCLPHVSLFLSLILGGRRIFDTSLTGGGIGLEYTLSW